VIEERDAMRILLALLLFGGLVGCQRGFDPLQAINDCQALMPNPEVLGPSWESGMAIYRQCADRVEARAALEEREEENARAGWQALGEGLNSAAASLRASAEVKDRAVANPPRPRESTSLPMPPPIEPVEVNPPGRYMAPAECLNHILVGGHC
jgi:hypothetical protein